MTRLAPYPLLFPRMEVFVLVYGFAHHIRSTYSHSATPHSDIIGLLRAHFTIPFAPQKVTVPFAMVCPPMEFISSKN